MATLKLSFFSAEPIIWDGKPIKVPLSKAEGVLYYLAACGTVPKDRLCDVFWGDSPLDLAKRSLRNAVYTLRKALGKDIIQPCAHDGLRLADCCRLTGDLSWLDASTPVPAKDIGAFLAFYQQDFLEGLVILHEEGYSDWLRGEQQRYRDAYISRLERSAELAEKEGLWQEARPCYEKMIRLDNYQELPYQKLIELLLRHNRRQEAVKLYSRLEALLKEELFIRPSRELTQLVEGAVLRRFKAAQEEFFFGREREQELLVKKYHAFLAGGAYENFCLMGEPGVGKSALLSAWREGLDGGCLVCCINNYSSEKDFPYKLWHSVCGQLNAMAGKLELKLGEDILRSLQRGHAMEGMPQTEDSFPSRMDYFVPRLLHYVCRQKPLLLVIDDIQWVDWRSMRLLLSMLSGNERIMLAAAGRDDHMDNVNLLRYGMRCGRQLQLIQMERFSFDETKALLQHIAPELQPHYASIYHESEGNVFFIMEAVRNLTCGLGADVLSPHMGDFIGARLSGLKRPALAVANLAAVMQNDMSLRLLRALCGDGAFEVVEPVDTLLSLGIFREFIDIRGEVCYCFTHQKLRDHIYSSISLSNRVLLHEKIANGLEALYSAGSGAYLPVRQLIYHYERSNNLYKVAALRLDRQERIAKRRYEMFRLNAVRPGWDMDILDDSPVDSGRELEKIHALLHNPGLSCGKEELVHLKFRYAYLFGRLCHSQSRMEEGKSAMEDMLRYARRLHKEEYLADAYLRLIFQSTDDYDLEQMENYISLAEALPRMQVNCSYASMVRHYKAVLLLRRDHLMASKALLEKNSKELRRLPVEYDVDAQIALGYYTLSTVALRLDDLEEAEIYIRMCREFCRDTGEGASAAMLNLNTGLLHYKRKHYEEALGYLHGAETFFAKNSFIENSGALYSTLTLLSIRLNHGEEARRYGRICQELRKKIKIVSEQEQIEKALSLLSRAEIS